MSIATVKAQIKVILDQLVVEEVLAGATVTDIRKDPLGADIKSYPHAFIMPPSLESGLLDNRTLTRTYSFDIMVLYRAENITGTAELETSIENILNAFDNNPTLNSSALGGMSPVSSAPEPFQHNGRDLIMVVMQVKAAELATLTYA